jgi:hypothetical protein
VGAQVREPGRCCRSARASTCWAGRFAQLDRYARAVGDRVEALGVEAHPQGQRVDELAQRSARRADRAPPLAVALRGGDGQVVALGRGRAREQEREAEAHLPSSASRRTFASRSAFSTVASACSRKRLAQHVRRARLDVGARLLRQAIGDGEQRVQPLPRALEVAARQRELGLLQALLAFGLRAERGGDRRRLDGGAACRRERSTSSAVTARRSLRSRTDVPMVSTERHVMNASGKYSRNPIETTTAIRRGSERRWIAGGTSGGSTGVSRSGGNSGGVSLGALGRSGRRTAAAA